jgi:hypothetical protein
VTWLYGPLHEHADPVPPPKIASARERLGLDVTSRTRSILKHRTISEMLTTPGRSASDNMPQSNDASREGSDDENEAHAQGSSDGVGTPGASARNSPTGGRSASLFSVRSDTNLVARKSKTGGSPPASVRLLNHPSLERADSGQTEERRHISFNQRVDQCISIDVPEEDEDDDDDEDDDYSDDDYGGASSSSSSRGANGRSSDPDTAESDDEVLTMKSSPRASATWPLPMVSSRGSSPGLEHHTIAKLAPTMLKTSDVYPLPSAPVVDPTGFSSSWKSGTPSRVSSQPINSYGGTYDPSQGAGGGDDSATRYSQWDADDDFGGEFDYFNGPDVANAYSAAASDGYSPPNTSAADAEAAHANVKRLAAAAAARNGGAPVTHVSPPLETQADEILGTSPSASGTSPAAPKSILKRRSAPAFDDDGTAEDASVDSSSVAGAAASGGSSDAASSSPELRGGSGPASPKTGRGRPAQRLGSSASYERIQDATRGSCGPPGSGSGRSRTSSNNSAGSAAGTSPTATFDASAQPVAVPGSQRSSERRDSFRGRAGDGSRAMGSSGSYAQAAARLGQGSAAAEGYGSDSDGRASLDFASPTYPASPQLGDKDGSDERDSTLYGAWADEAPSSSRRTSKSPSKSKAGKAQPAAEEEPRLSLDVDNLPSNNPNLSPPSNPGGPTPLNTPTLALAKARGRRRGGSKDSGDSGAGAPSSPTVPRRTSATGALVAPSGADREAGVRVPLAHDYVEEDEGGIVGRAVEMVNTARDLIGALWGGGDRGASWRQG